MTRSDLTKGIALLALLAVPAPALAQRPMLARVTDRVFAQFRPASGPGCAVGVDRPGQPRFVRAYGSAELEFPHANTAETLFEAGSVSKQFTATAIVLLAMDGKLRLDDDVRKYVPELPAYDRPITIRHLLNHTSGLRDWGDIALLAGWPRGTRAHTHEHVLEILGRQRALNYSPGDKYSYTNSGYNLAAIIVQRVSGMSFAEFSTRRIFRPLGLAHTQWRDGYTRVVPGRAQAYEPDSATWRLNMPFEDIQGNGGLLTTVGDLLTWTEMLEHPTPQWKPLVDSLHVQGRLTDGTRTGYALGLAIDRWRGVDRVSHTGATAGYRSSLARYPGRGVAIAILCNAANASPWAYGDELADSLLGRALQPPAPAAPRARPARPQWSPSSSALAAYAGEFYSPDVDAVWRVAVENGKLKLTASPTIIVELDPIAADTFDAFAGRVWFTRDASGVVTALHAATGRAYDVVFERRRTPRADP